MKEQWKDITGYEEIYQVSNQGRVKSLKWGKERILKMCLDGCGYCIVCLCKNSIKTTAKIHKLVAIAFLGHIRCGYKLVVNHKDFNKLNNCVDNLEIVTQRENTNKKHLKSSSDFVGVSWDKDRNRWASKITIEGKTKYLGRFTDEVEASKAYQSALNNLNKGQL